MNIMKSNLESSFKDYLRFKEYLDNMESLEKIKASVAEKSLELNDDREISNLFFKEIGELQLLKMDANQAKVRLYYTVMAYTDLIEIPEEILEHVDNFQTNTVFGIVNGEREIVNKELYETYKEQHYQFLQQQEEV